MFTPDARAYLRATYAFRKYSKRMPPRGNVVDPPQWWLDAFAAAMQARNLNKTNLAEMFISPGAAGAERKRQLNAARVRVTRFVEGVKDEPPIRTSEMVEVFCAKLGIPPFEFTAESRQEAEAMALAKRDPSMLTRVMAAGSLVVSLESGEHRLDDLLSRQTPETSSEDAPAPVRRRSRDPGTGTKHPRG